jgi:hypothetical protein
LGAFGAFLRAAIGEWWFSMHFDKMVAGLQRATLLEAVTIKSYVA